MVHIVEWLLRHFTYVALMLVLCASGMGVPIPEDIPLIFSGYLCNKEHSPINQMVDMVGIDTDHDGKIDMWVPRHHHVPHVPMMIIAGMIGVLCGDSIVFMIGRRGIDADNFVARHLRKLLHSKRRQRVERHFARHGNWTVFVGRFMPGLRSLVFGMAGMSRMSYLRFVTIDGLAALISVPTFIIGGWYFADKLNWLFGQIDRFKYHILLPCFVTLIIMAVLVHIVRKKRRLRDAASSLA